MAEDDGTSVFRVDKFAEEDMYGSADRVYRKVPSVFCESKDREG